MSDTDYSSLKVFELKKLCKTNKLSVSGTKAQLIERLSTHEASKLLPQLPVGEAILVDGDSDEKFLQLDEDSELSSDSATFQRMISPLLSPRNLKIIAALGLSLLMISAVLIIQPAWLGFEEELEFELIEYDASMARQYAQSLVDLGHPEWEGRMSGTEEEAAAAQMIEEHFKSLGMTTTLHSYEVEMHHVNAEPSLQVCTPGNTPLPVPPCSVADIGSVAYTFEHRIDYVIQGFSGSSFFQFGDDVPVVDLGNGSEESLWQEASGKIGYVRGGGSITGNTALMSKAAENDLVSLIRVNKDYNCGKVEATDCVPIFKGTSIEAITDANGGTVPTELSFIAMSKDAGEILEAAVINGSGSIAMDIDVTNDGTRTIYVPCGEIKGKSSEVIIAGAHHDTVYSGPGAIDDTSGTASIMEMSRQISKLVNESGTPDRTIRFCTWGGEEEGLYGSRAYVNEMKDDLKRNLRLYINLDMNHVDADFANRGNSLTLFTNSIDDYRNVESIKKEYISTYPDIANRYEIRMSALLGDKGDKDGMPYNSDHGPFVYDLGSGANGRAVVCYGSGSWEYHTYKDNMERFNEESLGVSVTIYGTYLSALAYNIDS
tara:strand:+ start:196 stop:2001 length:1806 start_codon:yes stop_codon:yes gene_type:complete